MNRASTLCVIGVIAAAETISLRADAISTGNLVVQTSTNRFLPTTAIGNACVTGQLGSGFGGIATAADWRSLAAPGFTDLGDPVGCTNQLFVRSANQPSIFYTYYDLNSYLGYRGDLPAAKFPAPVSAGDLITADLPGFTPDAVGEGKFVSSETSVGGVLTFRSATLTSSAEVYEANTTGKEVSAVATADTFDPWIFTPESDTLLTLVVSLQDVNLQADASSASILLVNGAFGVGSVPGQNVEQSFNEGSFIGETNGTLDISSMTLFDNTSAPFLLLGGDTYWLTADLEVGAASSVPEPSFLLVTGLTCAAFVWRCRKRSC